MLDFILGGKLKGTNCDEGWVEPGWLSPVTMIIPKLPAPKGSYFFYKAVFFIILKFLSLDLETGWLTDWFLFSFSFGTTGTNPCTSM